MQSSVGQGKDFESNSEFHNKPMKRIQNRGNMGMFRGLR